MNDHPNHTSDDASRPAPERGGGILTTLRRAARFGAGLLRAVAGAPAGVEQTRRGSFLVLVVATLALMSVFAVVYVTIGKADAGTQRGVKKGESRDDVPKQLADHVARIIGDDVFSTMNLGVDSDGEPFNLREVTDIPGVNWSDRSDSTSPHESFNPVGTYTGQWTGSGADPRGASDPFLASSVPTYLGYGDDGTKRVTFKQMRDWAAISNVAPDGRFVNLHNLRLRGFNATPTQMQDALTLLDDDGDPLPTLDFGGAPNFNIPAHFSNRQRGMFRPANTILVKGGAQQPNSPVYLDYQYADADGDGFYDARWFEMIDAHDPSDARNLLKTDDGMRYFFAVRVEDLSGRANVLSAMDMKGAPSATAENSIGAAPEVDLRRLLSLIDPLSDDPNDPDLQLGYAGLQQPVGDTQAKLAENYANYVPDLNGGMSMLVADYSYHALHSPTEGAIHTGLIPPPEVDQTTFAAFTYPEPKDRLRMYNVVLGLGRGLSTTGQVSAITGIEDLGELLTFRGLNDPTVTSQLEAALGGRYRNKAQGKDPDRETVRFSPLRDNRQLSLERDVDNRDGDVAQGDPDGRADIDAMLWSAFDVRQLLTPLSGARPLMATRVTAPMSSDQITNADLRRPLASDANSLYRIYADALVPDSAMRFAWNNSDAKFQKMKYGNYGATSAEFGTRVAAHMAANLQAAMAPASGTSPFAYTVLLDENYRPTLSNDWADQVDRSEGKPIASRTEQWAWWVDQGNFGKLDLGNDWDNPQNAANQAELRRTSRLGDSLSSFDGDIVESPAINVYGITPQPVLTAAASFYVYTDIPTKPTPATYGLAGDMEWEDSDEDGDGIPDGVSPKQITINGSVDPSNDDFLMQVVAFQLTNPFDATIHLTSNGMGEGQPLLIPDRFEYYIEFAGRYFRLANFNVLNPSGPFTAAVLKPGETRVFYAMCLPLQGASGDIVSRWNATKKPFSADKIKAWLDKQMSVNLQTGDQLPTLMEEFDPTTGKRKLASGFVDLLSLDSSVSAPNLPPTIESVRLWRALRTPTKPTGPDNENPKDLTKGSLPPQFVVNDQLVDRLSDPNFASGPTLDQTLNLGGSFQAEVPGTQGGPDNVSNSDPLDNTGFSITRFGLIRRNADPSGSSTGSYDPRTDGVPAYMIEGKKSWSGNSNITNKSDQGPANSAIDRSTFIGSGDGGGHDRIVSLWGNQSTNPVLPNAELTTEPRRWEKGELGANMSATAYADLRVSLINGIDSQSLRVSDLLLPLGIGPEYDPKPVVKEDRYLTLGEAMAGAFNYASPLRGASIYADMGTKAASASEELLYPTLDRGHLALDRFVPFFDGDANGAFDRTNPQDSPRGLGVPLALTIFDRAEAISGNLWDVDRPVIGRVNVNTASRTVLRSVGVLSPTPALSSNEWWWAGSNFDQRSDIASTLVAYRDKAIVWPRLSSPAAGGGAIDFRDNADSAVKPDEFDKLRRRDLLSKAPMVREAPGLASVGEVLLARAMEPSAPKEGNPWRSNPNNIDFMGFNSAADYKAGLSSGGESKMLDTYAERLQAGAAATSALSTRSDFFAVWFVVRGYRESDVKGLSAADPMVPSVQRRFVMVVDRSNVVKYGQKPRILLLKEVPF